jgi:hypothetical protein
MENCVNIEEGYLEMESDFGDSGVYVYYFSKILSLSQSWTTYLHVSNVLTHVAV